MTMMYLLFLLFAFQLFLVTPLVIRGEQVENNKEPHSSKVKKTVNNMERREEAENREETPFCKVNRTLSESIHQKTLKGRKEHSDIPLETTEHEVDSCRRENMYVDFTDLGLSDTIIAPGGFNAFYCKGKCSKTQQKKFLNRPLLLDLLEAKKGFKPEGEACSDSCVPTKLKPISVLVFDEESQVVRHTFEDMVVEECGCNNKDRKN